MSRLNRVKAAVCGEAGFIKLSLSATHFSLTEKLLVNYLFLLVCRIYQKFPYISYLINRHSVVVKRRNPERTLDCSSL